MDLGKPIREPRIVADPIPAKRIDAPIRAPIFTTPEKEMVPVRKEERR